MAVADAAAVFDRIRRTIRAEAERSTLPPDWPERVRSVCVVASSSRGGSSVFAAILRQSGCILSASAESTPFLRLANLAFPASGTGSDSLHARHASESRTLADLLRTDLGFFHVGPRDADTRARFAADLYLRFALQWPTLGIQLDELQTWISGATDAIGFLRSAWANYPAINPWYYDLPATAIGEAFPEIGRPSGPPGSIVLEEPPFIVVAPRRRAGLEDLERRTLFLKTASDAYRLPFWRAVFPRAVFRVIHLVRSPAAAINGLCDGWLHHGFHSHDLGIPLRIRGYSDVQPESGRNWWKFDLPPGWEEWTERPLAEVCAWQWLSAHRAIRDALDMMPDVSVYRFRFEHLIGDAPARSAAVSDLANWLGVETDLLFRAAERLPVVMATAPPSPERWRRRGGELRPILNSEEIRELARELGYDDPRIGT